MVRRNTLVQLTLCTLAALFFVSCSKTDSGVDPTPVDKCASKNITITTTLTNAASCSNSGGITVTAAGSSNFMYKLNSAGVYQTSNAFTNLAAGAYTVFVKDGDGCEKTSTVTLTTSTTAGPLFTAVKALMSQRCQPCHNNTLQNGNMNWEVDCNIVSNKSRIKVRAVDESSMPPGNPLTAAEKQKITDWIAAGGTFSN
jgi:hypothetical protein